jgi:hypothetical protein
MDGGGGEDCSSGDRPAEISVGVRRAKCGNERAALAAAEEQACRRRAKRGRRDGGGTRRQLEWRGARWWQCEAGAPAARNPPQPAQLGAGGATAQAWVAEEAPQ